MWNDDPSHHRRAGRSLGGATAIAGHVAGAHGPGVLPSPRVTVFRCVNGSSPGTARESAPESEWPMAVHEIAFPCVGRLQPEHLLKAFEAGADAVCVITCAGENCRYLEGSRRAERRVQYVRDLLDEIGLGAERLLVFHLAASPQGDATLGHGPNGGSPSAQLNQEEAGVRLAEVREMVVAGLGALPPSPLRQGEAVAWPRDGARRDGANGSRDTAG